MPNTGEGMAVANEDLNRFQNLTFEGFRQLAADQNLSRYEKIGFPDAYRAGYEKSILQDILTKAQLLNENGKIVLDIGAGCSELPVLLGSHCAQHDHLLLLIDSSEMLALLPDMSGVDKLPGYFPADFADFLQSYAQRIDFILVYSVIQYVFAEGNLFDFLDKALSLLADGGVLLIGDIPNISKRKRFFASRRGVLFHQHYMQTSETPVVQFNTPEPGYMDDAVLMALVMRCRSQGFDAYLVPQAPELPMSNRREDLLIIRP